MKIKGTAEELVQLYALMCKIHVELNNTISYQLVESMVEDHSDVEIIVQQLWCMGIGVEKREDDLKLAIDCLSGRKKIPVDTEYLLIIEMRKNNPVAIETGWIMCSQYLQDYKGYFDVNYNKDNFAEVEDVIEYTMIMLYEKIMMEFDLFAGRSFFSYAMSIAKYNLIDVTDIDRGYISTARKGNGLLVNQVQVVNLSANDDTDEPGTIVVADDSDLENDYINEIMLCDTIDYIMQVLDKIEIPYCRNDAPKEAIRLLYYKGDMYFYKESDSCRGINWTKLSRDIGTCKERSLKKHTLALFDILKAECIANGMNSI